MKRTVVIREFVKVVFALRIAKAVARVLIMDVLAIARIEAEGQFVRILIERCVTIRIKRDDGAFLDVDEAFAEGAFLGVESRPEILFVVEGIPAAGRKNQRSFSRAWLKDRRDEHEIAQQELGVLVEETLLVVIEEKRPDGRKAIQRLLIEKIVKIRGQPIAEEDPLAVNFLNFFRITVSLLGMAGAIAVVAEERGERA
jgi:hypothetical protein